MVIEQALGVPKERAAAHVADAKDHADRIRRDSERELAAATARRDSITAQLSNVRNMLATLGGGNAALSLAGESEHGASAGAAAQEVHADEVHAIESTESSAALTTEHDGSDEDETDEAAEATADESAEQASARSAEKTHA
jgi:hypothetical protein